MIRNRGENSSSFEDDGGLREMSFGLVLAGVGCGSGLNISLAMWQAKFKPKRIGLGMIGPHAGL